MSAYSAAVLALSPIGYWRCNEPSGSVAADTSGNGHNVTFSGTFSLGNPSDIPSDPTTGGTVSLPSSTGSGTTGTGTVANATSGTVGIVAWLKRTAGSFNPNGFESIASWNGVYIVLELTSSWCIGVTNFGSTNNPSTTVFPVGSTPHMLACRMVLATGHLEIYLDGALVFTTTTSAFAQSSASFGTDIGRWSTLGNIEAPANSFIGDVSLHDGLTAAQIANLYAVGNGATTSSGTSVQSAQTVAATGKVTIAATGTSVQSAQTVAATGKETIAGTGTSVQAAQNVAATGTSFVNITTTGTSVQSAQTVAAAGKETIGSTGTAVQSAQTVSATGIESIGSTGTSVQAAQNVSATATESIGTHGTSVQSGQTVAASGTSLGPPVTTTGQSVQAAQNVAAAGAVGTPPVTTTGSSVQAAQNATGSGLVTEPNVTTTGTSVQAAQAVHASGVVDAIGHAATVQAAQTVAALGHVTTITPSEIVIVNFVIETSNDIVLPILLRNT